MYLTPIRQGLQYQRRQQNVPNSTKYPSFNEHMKKMLLINSSGSHLNYCDIAVSGESRLPYKPIQTKKAKPKPLAIKIKMPLLRILDFRNKPNPPIKTKQRANSFLKKTIYHTTSRTPTILSKIMGERKIGLVLNKISGSVISKSPCDLNATAGRNKLNPYLIHRRAYTNKVSPQSATTDQAFMYKSVEKFTDKHTDLKNTLTLIKKQIAFQNTPKKEELRPWSRSSNNSGT